MPKKLVAMLACMLCTCALVACGPTGIAAHLTTADPDIAELYTLDQEVNCGLFSFRTDPDWDLQFPGDYEARLGIVGEGHAIAGNVAATPNASSQQDLTDLDAWFLETFEGDNPQVLSAWEEDETRYLYAQLVDGQNGDGPRTLVLYAYHEPSDTLLTATMQFNSSNTLTGNQQSGLFEGVMRTLEFPLEG